MNRAEESGPVDAAVLARLLAVAESIQAGAAGMLPDRLAWESECLQLLDRVWPRPEQRSDDGLIPDSVGRYSIIRELGRGGFGIVYLARDPNLGRDVALKVPLPGLIASPEVRRRFLREAQAVSGLDHPNIVPIHDAETVGPVAYIVSAYCPGPSLAAWLRSRTEPVAPRMAAELVYRLTQGVQHAHDRKILHRDLKPANIMLQPGGDAEAGGMTPRVTDFGLAKITDGSAIDETRTGLIIGSAPYMAPEQAASRSGEVGPATDVYALGVTLYEILVGRPPFVGRSPGETLHLVLTTEPVPPQLLRREVPRDLQTICLHALRKHPGHRYASADALGADLARFLDGEPILARPASVLERGWRWARTRPALATSVAAGFVLIGLIGVGMAWSNAWLRSLNDQLHDEVRRADQQATEADRQRRLVADREASTDRHLHAARLNLAKQAIDGGQNERAQTILAAASGATGPDRRDFAWHYLRNQARRDLVIWGHHDDPIRRVVLSPDGMTLASGDQKGRVQIWDVATGGLSHRFGGESEPVDSLVFAPDGTRLVVVESRQSSTDQIRGNIHAVASGRALVRLDLTGVRRVERIWFARDGRSLFALANRRDNRSVLMGWDAHFVAAGNDSIKPRFVIPNSRAAQELADGRSIWSLETEGRLHQRDARTGQIVRTFPVCLPELATMTFSADGQLLAGALPSGRVLVWDLVSHGAARVVTESAVCPDELVFRPDSGALLIVSAGYHVRLVDLRGGQAFVVVPLDRGRQGRLRFTFAPDSRWMVSTGRFDAIGNQPATVWDGWTGQPVRVYPGRLEIFSAQFDARSQAVLVANDYDVAAWQPATLAAEAVVRFDDHHAQVWAVAFAPDGRTLATGGDDHRLRLWDPVSGERSRVVAGHDATVAAVAWHPSGATIATGSLSERDNLKLWDAQTGQPIASLTGHTARVRSVVFSPDGAILASTGTDRSIRLWDGRTGQSLGTLGFHADVIRALAFDPHRPYLASVSNDHTVRVWDWSTRRIVHEFAERYQVSAVAYSPDGTTLASADEGGLIHLRDSITGQIRRVLHSDDREIRALAFAPDGQTLAAAGQSPVIRFWDPAIGQLLMELKEGTSPQINALAFSPDGSLLVAADHAGRALIFRGPPR